MSNIRTKLQYKAYSEIEESAVEGVQQNVRLVAMEQSFYARAWQILAREPATGPKQLAELSACSEPTAARTIQRFRGEQHGHSNDPRYVAVRQKKDAHPEWSAARIALELNIPVGEAKLQLARYYGAIQPGVKTPEPSYNHFCPGAVAPELYNRVKELIKKGAGPAKIAEAHGLSEPTARRLIERWHGEAEGHSNHPTYSAVRKLKEQFPQWGSRRVAHALGITIDEAKFWLARYAGAMTSQGGQPVNHAEKNEPRPNGAKNLAPTYTITAHNLQGNDFALVQLALPEKSTPFAKELIHMVLSHTNRQLTIHLQQAGENLLTVVGNRSTLRPNISALAAPANNRSGYQPKKGVYVKSRIEYIIYKVLERSGLNFEYEEKLFFAKEAYFIKPDFTIHYDDGSRLFWEHLGRDSRKYWRDWDHRVIVYKKHGLFDFIVTTDDFEGIDNEKLERIIQDLRRHKLANTAGNAFSNHHYSLC